MLFSEKVFESTQKTQNVRQGVFLFRGSVRNSIPELWGNAPFTFVAGVKQTDTSYCFLA